MVVWIIGHLLEILSILFFEANVALFKIKTQQIRTL